MRDVQNTLKELKANRLDIVDDAALKKSNVIIADVSAELKNLQNVGRVGFDETGQAIGKTTNAIGKAYSGLRVLANIIPGLGISGIFLAAFEGIAKVFGGLSDIEKKLKDIKSVGNVLAEATGSEAGDIARKEHWRLL